MGLCFKVIVVASIFVSLLGGKRLIAQDDVAEIASEDLRADKDESKRYFMVGPHKGVTAPKEGYGLLVVLPGGDGSAEFHTFIKRIYKNAVPKGYMLAQPVAVKWTAKQEIVWPTSKNRVDGMKFSTEEFVDAVIKDLGGRHPIDPGRMFTIAWSSSGPAAYAVSLTSKKVTGSFIAMSVFKRNFLPPLENANGHVYYLYHSPDDRVCPFRMAEQAAKDLEENGATIKLATYQGGHGWQARLYDDIREGVRWLEKNRAADQQWPLLSRLSVPESALPPKCSIPEHPRSPIKGVANRRVTIDPRAFVLIGDELTQRFRKRIKAAYYAVYEEGNEIGIMGWAFDTLDSAKDAHTALTEEFGDKFRSWQREQYVICLWRDTGTSDKCFQHFEAFIQKQVDDFEKTGKR
jgi:predicted esterase